MVNANQARAVFFIGVMGGLVGYACGAMFTPGRAVAQITSSDAGAPVEAADAGATPTQTGTFPRPTCLQWEVKMPEGHTIGTSGPYGGETLLLEEGWEPFAYAPSDGRVVLRRCVR
jgi:hypothetical protein